MIKRKRLNSFFFFILRWKGDLKIVPGQSCLTEFLHIGIPILINLRLGKLMGNTLATWCEELTHLKRPWCWERLRAGEEGDNRGWDGWMVSPTQWTWVWVDSGSWWWTGRPGMLRFMGSQRVGHDWVTELNWTLFSSIMPTWICTLVLIVFVNNLNIFWYSVSRVIWLIIWLVSPSTHVKSFIAWT